MPLLEIGSFGDWRLGRERRLGFDLRWGAFLLFYLILSFCSFDASLNRALFLC